MSRGIRTSRHLDPRWERPQGLISTECFPGYMLASTLGLDLSSVLITSTIFVFYNIMVYTDCVQPLLLGECFRRLRSGLLIISSSGQMSRRTDPELSRTNPCSVPGMCARWESEDQAIRPFELFLLWSERERKAASSGFGRLRNGNGWNIIWVVAKVNFMVC